MISQAINEGKKGSETKGKEGEKGEREEERRKKIKAQRYAYREKAGKKLAGSTPTRALTLRFCSLDHEEKISVV